MQQTEQCIEISERSLIGSTVDRLAIGWLDHFEIPRREFVPEEFVDCHQGFRQTELAEEVVDLGNGLVELHLEPFHSLGSILRLSGISHFPTLDKTERVPDFVVEVTSLLAKRIIVKDVVAGRSGKHQTHTHTICTEFLDKHQWVRRVAERLRHLAAEFVADNTCKVDVAERFVALVFVASHNHTRNPEEDDIWARNEVGCRIVVFDFLILRLKDTVEERHWPQPRREPCVEHVLVLTEVGCLEVLVAGLLLSQSNSLFNGLSHHIATLRKEVGWDAVTPPELARDTPVLDVGHPVAVGVLKLSRVELDIVVHHSVERRLSQLVHLQEPLH